MPPVRTSDARASKACDACRARKTRCYESGSSKACLRCSTLSLVCSLDDGGSTSVSPGTGHSCALVEQRISHLEKTVERLSTIVASAQLPVLQSVNDTDAQQHEEFPVLNQKQSAPLVVIQDAASDAVLETGAPSQGGSQDQDIITKGIISKADTEQLLVIFQTHYGRWVGLDESGHQRSFIDNIKTPLLLCTCCLIAVRHSKIPSIPAMANVLFLEAKALLGKSMLHAQQSIEFFQATLLLSLWSTTLGQRLMSIDSWLISGFALQHRLATDVFKSRSNGPTNGVQLDLSNRASAVWNHLCLAHLHACVSMRRKSMIGENDITRARQSLSNDCATNFELRMVAELHLYWTIYGQCVATDVNLPRAKAALQSWKEEWAFLFDQPRRQFLQISFFFAGLLIYEQSLSSKSAAVRESVVSEMVRLSSDVLSLSMDKHDERTKHLTDHVYHIITFAAVTLCRLLCRYESQLKSKFDFGEKDALVSTTINWLCSIDSAPHIGKVMSKLITNVQGKLRPGVQNLALQQLDTSYNEPEFNTIPDFLAIDDYFDFDWDAMVPDWQSLASDEFINSAASV